MVFNFIWIYLSQKSFESPSPASLTLVDVNRINVLVNNQEFNYKKVCIDRRKSCFIILIYFMYLFYFIIFIVSLFSECECYPSLESSENMLPTDIIV